MFNVALAPSASPYIVKVLKLLVHCSNIKPNPNPNGYSTLSFSHYFPVCRCVFRVKLIFTLRKFVRTVFVRANTVEYLHFEGKLKNVQSISGFLICMGSKNHGEIFTLIQLPRETITNKTVE